jgi:hypothetical protein
MISSGMDGLTEKKDYDTLHDLNQKIKYTVKTKTGYYAEIDFNVEDILRLIKLCNKVQLIAILQNVEW